MLPPTFLVLFSTYNNLSFTCRFYCVYQLVYLCYGQVSAGRDHFSVHIYIPMHIGFEQFSKLHMYFILFATIVQLRVKLRYNGSILIVNYLFSKFCSTCMQGQQLSGCDTVQRETFKGENFCGFVAIRKFSSRNLGARHILVAFSPNESFPLYSTQISGRALAAQAGVLVNFPLLLPQN